VFYIVSQFSSVVYIQIFYMQTVQRSGSGCINIFSSVLIWKSLHESDRVVFSCFNFTEDECGDNRDNTFIPVRCISIVWEQSYSVLYSESVQLNILLKTCPECGKRTQRFWFVFCSLYSVNIMAMCREDQANISNYLLSQLLGRIP
jgi:hypothetical protein